MAIEHRACTTPMAKLASDWKIVRLNDNWFVSLTDAQQTIEAHRRDYNTARPHSSLGDLTPSEYAASWSPLTVVD